MVKDIEWLLIAGADIPDTVFVDAHSFAPE